MSLTQQVLNIPHFAPFYKFKNDEDFSLLEMIKKKGYLKINTKAIKIIDHPDFLFCPPNTLIDSEIKRVEYSWKFDKIITQQDVFVSSITKAMIDDAKKIEDEYTDHTILALVGGKDSLNMLLLPWRNPLIVASAAPNYSLVKKFLSDNNLNYDIIQLDDERNLNIEKEILINCCRLKLDNCRWTGHLSEIVSAQNSKVVILIGQWGDNLLTNKWKKNILPPPDFHIQGRYNKLLYRLSALSNKFERLYSSNPKIQSLFFRNLWYESAHWQGVHMSFLYEYLGCPVLSIYHNDDVMKIISQTDYVKVVTTDLRPTIGDMIFGRKVIYPEKNPSPPVSRIRKDISGSKIFLDLIQVNKISIKF
jgi:hypothetical protein